MRRMELGHAGVAWLTLMLLLLQGGCAPISRPLPSPLPLEVRAELGKVGVVSGRFVPATVVERPVAGKVREAAKGAAGGALAGAALVAGGFVHGGCSGDACGFVAVVMLGVLIGAATVGAVTGAVIGAVTTESVVKAREAEVALQYAFAELKIQETFRDRLVTIARDEARLDLIPVTDPSPTDPDVDVDYRPLVAQGLNTILEVSVTRLGLIGDRSGNPPLTLSMTTRVRVIRSGDGAELYRQELHHQKGSRKFVEWAAHDAQAFRRALDAAYTDLSREIVRLVAPSIPAPAPAAPEQPSPESTLRAIPVNEWRTAPLGEHGETVRYQVVEKGSPLDVCAPPLVSVRVYEGGVSCVPAELLR
jgi:hypothetical protein